MTCGFSTGHYYYPAFDMVGDSRYSACVQGCCMVFFLIVLIQIGYILGTTSLNDVIPFSEIFKYDVISAVANLFPDTMVQEALLKVSAFLRQIFTDFAATVQVLWDQLHLEHIWESIKDGFDAVYGDL